METLHPYESAGLREVTGPTLRPGGFSLTRRAVELCNLPAGALVLDIGCGLGATVHWLEANFGLKTLGLDASMTSSFGRTIASIHRPLLWRVPPIGSPCGKIVSTACSANVRCPFWIIRDRR